MWFNRNTTGVSWGAGPTYSFRPSAFTPFSVRFVLLNLIFLCSILLTIGSLFVFVFLLSLHCLIYLKHLSLLDFTSASVASVVVFMSFIMSRPTLKTKQYSSENFLKAFDHTKDKYLVYFFKKTKLKGEIADKG
jgi:hypothetical protein